jgi:hypothetical protein
MEWKKKPEAKDAPSAVTVLLIVENSSYRIPLAFGSLNLASVVNTSIAATSLSGRAGSVEEEEGRSDDLEVASESDGEGSEKEGGRREGGWGGRTEGRERE